ncbi:MAG TPA: RsmB/NOP family class I SAM-dependent RNA methyltransferase [Chlamydiales bacterium]|nr:RsmB/NOP family class I SAM-dependent RNA methyltransferase [Chlamydiales bacterium]
MKEFIPFRKFHLLKILKQYEKTPLPLDFFLNGYFRANKQIGSKDKKAISDVIYDLIRWRGLIDYLRPNSTWEDSLDTLEHYRLDSYRNDPSIEEHIRVSFPRFYYELLKKSFQGRAFQLAELLNTKAPTTIRANTLKTTRDELLQAWKEYNISPCEYSALGIRFLQKVQLHTMPEFKKGFFEIQDEGSQQIANLIEAKPGDHVLDFCSGSGGKTLAFAPSMKNKGQIYLHDIRSSMLLQAKKRLNRAGIQNAQFVKAEDLPKKNLIEKMDWVLIDVPCSGSGTLRRNPDMKWKFNVDRLHSLVQEQRAIFNEALRFCRKGGKIVYATCSLFQEENQEQVDWAIKNHPVRLLKTETISPEFNGRDGFFAAVFEY